MPMKNKTLHFLCDSRHFLKDLNIALGVAQELKINLPVLKLAQEFFNNMCNSGYSEKGTQAIYEYYKVIK